MACPDRGRLRRSDRLRTRKDFQRLSREGARRSSRNFVLLLAPRFEGRREGLGGLSSDPSSQPGLSCRLGITVSRKVGNAVVRSRVKRGIREWFRSRREKLPADRDLVVIARPGAATLSATEMAAELDGALS